MSANPVDDRRDDLTARLKAEAIRLGFDQVGIAPAVRPAGFAYYEEWLDRGYAAGMEYLRRHAPAKAHPEGVLPGVRSLVIASIVYGHPETEPIGPTRGRVARYARGADYHQLFWQRLGKLLEWLKAEAPGIQGRAVSDTAPLLEREFAQLAGLGWIGKNTMLIDRRLGSYTLLGALLVDRELTYDEPHLRDHCGTCTRCLEACPTSAFVEPYQLDASRCLSYWTIEHRGPIPDEFAEQLSGWVFGCDICQEVCPWNRKAPSGRESELAPRPGWSSPDLIEWLQADPTEFRRRLKATALSRSKRSGLLRNAALLLGQRGVVEAVPALTSLLDDDDPLVRDSAAWALGQIQGRHPMVAGSDHLAESEPSRGSKVQSSEGREQRTKSRGQRTGHPSDHGHSDL